MSGPEANLFDAYEKIQSDKVHDRSSGLSDLKHILINNRHTKGLNDKGYHKMFEAIFRAAVKEKMIYARQNKSSLLKSVAARLSLSASVLRLAVEQGVVHIRNKTFKALSKHIIDILPLGEGLCEPISLDYIKALRTCLAYSPHAEHIDRKEWETMARFCCTHVESQLGLLNNDPESGDEGTGGGGGGGGGGTGGKNLSRETSTTSRRSLPPSQGIPRLNHDSEELMLCLEILLRTPNAPIVEHDEMVVRTIVGFLVSQPTVTRAHPPAVTALNSVLEVITTNNISLAAKVAQRIVPVLAKLWDSKQPTFREQMMITLIYILPQIRTIIGEGRSRSLRRKMEALSEVLFVECSGRADRDQLQLDDLVFPDPLKTFDSETVPLGLQAFGLRKGNQKTEMNWIVPQLMATVIDALDRSGGNRAGPNNDSKGKAPAEEDRNKRLKVSKHFEELIRNARSMITSRKLCALQTLPFLVCERDMDNEEFSSVLLDLFNACSDDNPVISSWALLSIASCAFSKSASDPSHRPIWNQIWQLCARYSANQATCRAACHLMRIILAVDLVPYTQVSKEVDAMILSIDLSGPANVVDSSLAVWCLILEKRNTVAHSSLLQPGERLLQWLISKWRPVDALERGTASFYSQHVCPENISSFLLSCCGRKPLDFEPYAPRSCGPIGQAVIKISRHARLLSFLLLGDEVVPADTTANTARANSLRESQPTAHPGVELQVVEFLDRQCDVVRERWQTLTTTQLQHITPDIVQNLIGFICTGAILCSTLHPRTRHHAKIESLERKLDALCQDALGYVEREDCGAKQVEGLIRCVAGVVPRPDAIINSSYSAPEIYAGMFGRVLAAVSQVFEEKNTVKSSIDLTEDGNDMMDLDDGFDMPGTGRAGMTKVDLAREVVQAACATETFQHCTTALLSLLAQSTKHDTSDELCRQFVGYLTGLSKERLIMSRPLIRDFLFAVGDRLADNDAAELTEHLATALLKDHSTERCETAVQLCIDALSALVPRWGVDGVQSRVASNCESIYEWMTKVSLERDLMSSAIRISMAHLLQRILEVNAEYGKNSETKSARTQFIGLLAAGDVRVSFELANCVPILFGIFGLTVHETVFKDILAHLTDQLQWVEGLAMRVYTLAQLAYTAFSTKKLIVYHIFETGQIVSGEKYAAKALSSVAKALKLDGHRGLFKIFSPQLLYTWIDNDELARFPFRVFGYSSLKELFADVQEDLVAQLLMKDRDDASEELAGILDITYDELLEKGFHKILAYGVAGAIATPPRAGTPRPPNVELRIRQRLGDDECKLLLEKKFALIIASLFQVMQEDGISDRFLSKDPSLAAAAAHMREVVEISHSTSKIPDPLRPHFKVKVVLNAVHHLCGRLQYDDTRLWTPAMFAFVARRLLDTMDPALGSLNACAVVRKIRLLVCLANPKSIDGYALEMVIHGLKPYIVDTYCAEDAVGVVLYLLEQGKSYLSTQPAFVIGTFLSILASLRAFTPATTGHEDSQVRLSLNIAQSFHIWLGDYLTGCHFPELNEQQNQMFQAIVESAMEFRLHGNASSGTRESDLLRHLLDDDRSKNRLLDDVSRRLAFSLVCSDFRKPASFRDDIFGSDEESVARSRVLLRTCRRLDVSQGFLLWAARVLGRSYAASGDIHNEWTQEIELEKITDLDTAQCDLDIIPKAGIFQRLKSLLLGDDRLVIGLAEGTLETIFFDELASPGVATFHYILEENLYKAMKWSILPISLSEEETPRLITSVAKPETLLVDEWVKNMTTAISTNLQEDAVVKNLRPILEKVDGLAKDLFPFVVHILLLHHVEGDDRLKMELSQLFRDCFRSCTEKTVPHCIVLIKTILYLRTQETVQEVTKLPRDHWLDVDYLEMARAACTCKMFKTSLLFAEIYHSESSSAEFPDPGLLLEVFKNVDDLDSYYGVNQSSSLETVLGRFEYEGDGWKSLSFRGANLESHLRLGSASDGQDLFGVVDAFNTLGMNGLSHAFLQSGTAPDTSEDTLDNMFRSAWKLEQWDLPCPSSCTTRSAIIYRALQSVNNNVDMRTMPSQLDSSFLDVMCQITAGKQTGHSLGASMRTLAMLTEMEEVLVSKETEELEEAWERLQKRNSWMNIGRYSDVEEIMAMRQTTFSSVAKREHLRRAAEADIKTARFLEAKALVASCEMARSHKVLQHSLSAAMQLSKAVESCKQVSLDINAVATLQAANVLWDQGQGIASIRMLQALQDDSALGQQSIVVGKAELLAKLGNWISEARLEKPDKIMSNYLVFAIDGLKGNHEGSEAGRVFHEFASFCDQQLQNPGNIEDYQRALKLRQNKEAEVRELEKLLRSATGAKLENLTGYVRRAKTWLNLDDAEFNRLKLNREAFLERSISNYLRALTACDDYDHDAVRFCALWLEHSGDVKVNKAAQTPLEHVASRKFVPLMNQLSSRILENPEDMFQSLLFPLILRICMDHPHHGLYQILALTRVRPKDNVSTARQASAMNIVSRLKAEPVCKSLFNHIYAATAAYIKLATQRLEKKPGVKTVLKSVLPRELYSKFSVDIPNWKIPPPTMQIDVRPDRDYTTLPVVMKFHPEIAIASGMSAPKIVTCLASDGRTFKMLFKGGNDDLRQDAIMEQVFEQVSNLLQKSRTTRQRNLSIRTYRVLPLSTGAGVIEFVPNTIPLHDFLMPAHTNYHPKDWKSSYCRKAITDVQTKSRETRIDTFQKVTRHFRPVMRYFFMHKFNGPDDWFGSRLAYSRSTAAISILGHVLGLGDRHGHNILLDEKSGEVVHIDLGVAFEQGRVLPVPEVVPFRLTRDVVDGFGVTRTEGVFRRSCEFTLAVLRNQAYNIVTILDVLRYDPLYSWTISPLRMKKMQEQVEAGSGSGSGTGAVVEGLGVKKDEESEADRALTVVAKKLSATLSVGATVNELIQVAGDERNLAVLYSGWAAYV